MWSDGSGWKEGVALSLLKGGQVRLFERMRWLIERPDRVGTARIQKDLVKVGARKYRDCIQALRQVLAAEEEGELSATDALPLGYVP